MKTWLLRIAVILSVLAVALTVTWWSWREWWSAEQLTAAIEASDVDQVRLIAKLGGDCEARNEESYGFNDDTALHRAVNSGQHEIVKILLVHGAEVDVRSKGSKTDLYTGGRTAIFWAVYYGHKDILRLLILYGADVNMKDYIGMTPLFLAQSPDVMDILFENGADPNAQDVRGRTCLFNKRKPEMIDYLVSKGADPNARRIDGITPLHIAATGHPKMMTALLRNGADVNARSDDGMTPLHRAAKFGFWGLCKTLIQAGANPHINNNDGQTPIDLRSEMAEIVKEVEEEKAAQGKNP